MGKQSLISSASFSGSLHRPSTCAAAHPFGYGSSPFCNQSMRPEGSMMFFIPPAILAIEDEDDRSFMENLYRSYYRLMYHEIFTVTSDPWLAEDILQNVVISLIRNLSTIKKLSTANWRSQLSQILSISQKSLTVKRRAPNCFTFKKRMHKSLWRSFMSWMQKISIF